MKKVFLILLSSLLVSCTKTLVVSELFNALQSSEKAEFLDAKLAKSLQVSDSRTLIYSYNTQCSQCVSQFVKFLQHVDDYRFDSLLIVAHEAYDFIQSEYIMQKLELSIPDATRIVFDPENDIYDLLVVGEGMVDLLLIEDKRVLAKCNTQIFSYDESLGYCVNSKMVKRKK